MSNSYLTKCLYKYFSYRFVWVDDDLEQVTAAANRGSAPVPSRCGKSQVVSMPGINSFTNMAFEADSPISS